MHAIYRNKTADANCRQVAKNQTDKLGLHGIRHREVIQRDVAQNIQHDGFSILAGFFI